MTDEMPDSIERPHIFAAIEERYQKAVHRSSDRQILIDALADPNPTRSLIDTREQLLTQIDGTKPNELAHVRHHWYGNDWLWDFLPTDLGTLPKPLPADVQSELASARQEARSRIKNALTQATNYEEHERAAILRLMIGEDGAGVAARKLDGEERARAYAQGLVEFIDAIDRIVSRTGREPDLQVRWVCEAKPNQFEVYVDWSPSHASLTVLTPKVVESGKTYQSSASPGMVRDRDRGTLIVRPDPELAGSRTVVSTPRLYQVAENGSPPVQSSA